MKQGLKLLALAVAAIVTISSCSDLKYDAPLLTEPKVEGLTPNVTIAELKREYSDLADRTSKEIEYEYVLKAVVSANDVSGNIYKQIYIQDETGGIAVSIDQNEIAGTYPVGQEVFIDLHGLAISMYGGQPSIAHPTAQKNRIPFEIVKKKMLPNGWPNADLVQPKTVKISDLTDDLVGRLIRIDNVYFEQKGQPFAPAQETVNRLVTDAKGASIIVRNSGYADFAADKLPEGTGSIVAVLSKFGNDYQLFLRSREDVIGFAPDTPPSDPSDKGGSDTPTPETGGVILDAPFSKDLAPFVAVSVKGEQSWRIKHQSNKTTGEVYDHFAFMSGHDGTTGHANEDWLISPLLDLTGVTSATLTFKQAINFATSATIKECHQLVVSTDYKSGTPSSATWTPVTITLPEGKGWKFMDTTIDLPKSVLGQGAVHFALKYTSPDGKTSSWEIKELKLKTLGGGKVISEGSGSTIDSMKTKNYDIAN